MTDKLSVADVLDRAATLIEPPFAWQQGAFGFYSGSTCWCAVGAIAHVLNVGPNLAELWIDREGQRVLGMSGEGLEDWNDDVDRTQSQVVSKFREAANLARERGL